jgi:hypothetical protein
MPPWNIESAASRRKRYSSPLVLCLALAAPIACNDDGDRTGDEPGTAGSSGKAATGGSAGSGGKTGAGGTAGGAGGKSPAGGTDDSGGKSAAGGTADSGGKSAVGGAAGAGGTPDTGGVGAGAGDAGQQSGGSSNDGGSDGLAGGGHAGAPAETCGGELARPRTRWTAYVVENDLGQTTLFAAKSGALNAAVPLLEVESPITSLTWSPNGRFLAFVHDQGPFSSALHVVDFDGEELEVMDVAVAGNETPGSPRWSPDSTRLLYAEPSSTSELRVVDFSTAAPGATAIFRNCPQGVYSDYPCLGSFIQPLRLEWSPTGNDLAGIFVAQFFTDFGTGSAADLFLLRPESAVSGKLASPYVPNFDPARRGVTPESLVWSPDGARVASTGSFEDTGSVTEAYVFAVSGASAAPIKLHADLAEPNEGVRPSLAWASATTVVYASDASSAGAHALLSIDVSAPNAGTSPNPQTLLSAAGGSILEFALSPDRSSVLVLRQAPEADAATLTVFPFGQAPLSAPHEVSSSVATVGEGFGASAQWSEDSKLLAFAEEGAATLKIAGRMRDGSSCIASSLEVDIPAETWRWLADESSVVMLDATGIHRLPAGSNAREPLSAPLEPNERITGWAVQPRGNLE